MFRLPKPGKLDGKAAENMRAKRKMATAVAALVLGTTGVMGTGTAWAVREEPKKPQPTSPPGLEQSGVDRPEQAATPRTGATNQFK